MGRDGPTGKLGEMTVRNIDLLFSAKEGKVK